MWSPASWVAPIDVFILATLEARGLQPAAPADRRTLIRRVTFDLHGLPPTPEESDAFVTDHGPGAYEVPSRLGAGDPQFELQLTDMTTWVSSSGGMVTVLTDDGTHVRGTVEGGLTGPGPMRVSGTWGCARAGA